MAELLPFFTGVDASTSRLYGFAFWSSLWVLLLVLPPGSQAINTSYRLNFCAGLFGTAVSIAFLYGYVPETFATMATITYFAIDFINIIINDFYFKAPSYQSPANRKMEYFHHIFCLFFGVTSEFTYTWVCTFDHNPFIELVVLSEFSTPFLMAWRYTNSDALGLLFFIVFFICRIVLLGFYFLPECIKSCHPLAGWGFSVPYYCVNFYFLYMMIKKMLKKAVPEKSKEKKRKD
jgi:hypothetical protein